jgi:Uma2 family endonuclease
MIVPKSLKWEVFLVKAITPEQKYTYQDYLQWNDGERWELIDGVPYNMSPAPSTAHQRVIGELFFALRSYLKGKTCEVFTAPFDVHLFASEKNEETDTVVQPDLSIICDPNKIDEKGCKGSPDLIIEVLSPATARKDKWEKFHQYEKAGVKEYWIVDVTHKMVETYVLVDEKYNQRKIYSSEDEIRVSIFEDFTIPVKTIF